MAVCLLGAISVLTLVYTQDLVRKQDSFQVPSKVQNRNISGNDVIRKTRVLCLILTSASGQTKMAAVKATWAKRCHKYLFIYGQTEVSQKDESFLYVPVQEGRSHLTAKVRHALEYAYQTYKDSFDWILKSDDDTYVIIENLLYLLSHADSSKPGYLGFHMKTKKTSRTGYMSGGGGYVISSRGLHQLIHVGFQDADCRQDGGDEDVEIGLCLTKSNVSVLNSLDSDGRQTFHPESLLRHLYPPYPKWLQSYSWNQDSANFGSECCSKYSVSFHHISVDMLYMIDHLLYKTKVYDFQKVNDNDKRSVFNPHVVNPAYK
ncbi:glycoprotein-N-acetylgalactosamine 3-beta-galactosyltransferase 1-like [Ruditapes philippinarum]|uniref:glycoprotein-N-acetylgalactosamine 3-beta-galactosyltransferase 1-like n=1 Tax=Ruditapes philippinarum TaxID=129788 RepID=UPI00295B01AB|nr:glycoprotein-N-acetylgalactosamine 3-beta-galactosyltransferase 1-like [Ruditapes philippinarum]